MTDPTPLTVQPDPRPSTRPANPAGGKAHWDALTEPAVATGGFTWQEIRDGATIEARSGELLPVDVNSDLEQEAPGALGNDAP